MQTQMLHVGPMEHLGNKWLKLIKTSHMDDWITWTFVNNDRMKSVVFPKINSGKFDTHNDSLEKVNSFKIWAIFGIYVRFLEK